MEDVDSVFIGQVSHGEEMMSIMAILGTNSKSYQREGRAARKRMVAEIYSPPRVTRAISSMPECGLVPGFALDLTCTDPDDGMPWDFDVKEKREKAMEIDHQ